MLHSNQLANRLPNSLNNTTNVIKSHILVANVHASLERRVVQTKPMRGYGKVLQSYKQHTMGMYVLHVRLCF